MQSNQLSVMEFENTDLSKIVQWSECPAGEPLFQSVVVFENYPVDPVESDAARDPANLVITGIEYKEQSDLPLALIALPGNGLNLILIYDAGMFKGRQVERMLAQVRRLLCAMSGQADAPLGELPFLTDAERQTLLVRFNDTDRDIDAGRFVDDLILEQADVRPDATALVCGRQSLTYADLANRSRILASHLTAHGIGPGKVVGIGLPRGVDALVWMLAVLRSGAAYLMLDPEYPAQRLCEMLSRSGASMIVTDRAHGSRFESATCARVVADDDRFVASLDATVNPPIVERKDSDTVYILFTSGSTGVPKGVIISHRNLVHSTLARDHFYSEPPEAFLLLSSFSFDSSVAGIFWTLANGGKLVISGHRQEQRADSLVGTIDAERVTHTLCLPSLYHSMLDYVSASGERQLLARHAGGDQCR